MITYIIKRTGNRYIDISSGKTIDAYYPKGDMNKRSCLAVKHKIIRCESFEIETDISKDITSTEDAYLRLQLLSSREYKPNEINLEGIFQHLPNVAWTSAGPVFPEYVQRLRHIIAEDYHQLTVFSVDKFPRMVDYIVPSGVRIADADRVRLGAYISQGTTVMHEGFINFNAGTLGQCMVEGRITPGVTVGDGSDVGAGASIMGTLSGGGKQKNQIGKGSLLGANAGIGISLGDSCIVEAGLYVTSGTKVTLPDGSVDYARNLSGKNNLLFRRNSLTGSVEVLTTDSSVWGGVNAVLHQND
ncbi:DapH/DapD/GlmU-related protein [Klebsiella pneumoniae]|uniref:2,3,4,5-tetrahydropyridine-2,6-dicarboxylate N-succinyltransferase n=13 Tax=Klebsiella pneumoniae TaxID=573 RepID=A0A4S8CQ34_KLEPN|nr:MULTISPECIES: DapH/DapD/GlmU-related protein [Klebsiella]HCI4279041.1 tetrahydrodipicolinate succinyltransferase [Klebsiella variicola subsp. variicola]AIX85483.1 tetrahydrodipicolinate succinyltransferase [Klebsiella pneumoniae subsp. pneumoniae]ANE69294.1 tetrahydrodipicolinate succinyltransferase [Klebsiella pneumoniae]ANF42362.1 tetrahydrodipicolinate succinyltransferase [Klebsiella pneumoniae]ANK43033.1 tetrahydrodipicolinate succinyltransferase [Klebsiella pneumoniae]